MNTGPVKRREPFHLNIPGRYLLLIVTGLCVAMIAVTYFTNILDGPLAGFANYVVVPFQDGVSRIGEWMVEREQLVSDITALQEENAKLKSENEELSVNNNALQQEKVELDSLRKLYQLDGNYADYEKTGARIIARDSGSWYHSFIIDKGTNDGLALDMNVLADGGLVGRIVFIGPDWARVEAIIDDDASVSAAVLNTQDTMIVSGDLTLYEQGDIRFSELSDPEGDVQVGDKVVTSNISDKYLPGIMIGYISGMEEDPNNLTKSGTITPAVDFAHMDTVLVILENKQTVDESTGTDVPDVVDNGTSADSEADPSSAAASTGSSDSAGSGG